MGWAKGKRYGKLTLEIDTDKLLEIIGEDGVEINEVESNTEVSLIINGKTYYDPGCMYLPNGDPGNPPEYDEEFPLCEEDEKAISKQIGDLFFVTLNIDEEVEYEDDDL